MRRVLYIITVFVLATACKKSSTTEEGTTVTADNMSDIQPGKSTNFFEVNLTASPVSAPMAGVNQTWDFSNFAVKSQYTSNYETPAANPAFSGATYVVSAVDTFGNGTISASSNSKYYNELSSSSWASLGRTISQVVLSYPAVGASITYPAQAIPYSSKIYYATFPMKYGDSTGAANITSNANFFINAPLFGMVNTPGALRNTTNYGIKVIGSGTVKLKGYAAPMPALVVRQNSATSLNFFLNGAPAPPMLLSLAGITDGEVVRLTSYSFYSPSVGYLGTIHMNSTNTAVASATFRKNF